MAPGWRPSDPRGFSLSAVLRPTVRATAFYTENYGLHGSAKPPVCMPGFPKEAFPLAPTLWRPFTFLTPIRADFSGLVSKTRP